MGSWVGLWIQSLIALEIVLKLREQKFALMLNVLVLLMGEGQETSERPASFHEHRAVW